MKVEQSPVRTYPVQAWYANMFSPASRKHLTLEWGIGVWLGRLAVISGFAITLSAGVNFVDLLFSGFGERVCKDR